jgi:ribulose-5-phosphate 4-epimerase/fuculose-1-phosphate aldolase
LAKPTNASLGLLDPTSISRLDLKGNLVSGDKPTKEIPRHAALYETVKQSQVVAHWHSTRALALSILPDVNAKDVLPPMTPSHLMRAGRTALSRISGLETLPSLTRSKDWQASTLGCCLPHAPVVAGKDLEGAVYAIEEPDETAKLHLFLGNFNPRHLSPLPSIGNCSIFRPPRPFTL